MNWSNIFLSKYSGAPVKSCRVSVNGFEKIGDLTNVSTSGNYMQAAIDLIQITGDSGWGTWPNSFEGFIALGVTVEAGLSGFDIDITLLDQTAPGLMIMATQTQTGNNNCVVNNLNIDIDNQKVSLDYIDSANEEGSSDNSSEQEPSNIRMVSDDDGGLSTDFGAQRSSHSNRRKVRKVRKVKRPRNP